MLHAQLKHELVYGISDFIKRMGSAVIIEPDPHSSEIGNAGE
jgi:hypothetical protein